MNAESQSRPQPPHVFSKHDVVSNDETSRHVAGEFCRAYQRQFNVTASVLETETQNLDAIISIDGVEVALELVSYRQRDELFEDEASDSVAKEQISQSLREAGLPPINIRIWWNTEVRRKVKRGMSARRAKVPRRSELTDFAAELVRLAQRVQDGPDLEKKHLGFRDDPSGPNRHAPNNWRFVESSVYPTLSNYCYFVELEKREYPTIRTSADVRNVGVDRHLLQQNITSKLKKIGRYRDGVSGKSVWLVIHSDGTPMSARVPPSLREEVRAVIQEELTTVVTDSFDEVWWAENTGFADSAELFEVSVSRNSSSCGGCR